jgi:hypothetical protein
MEASLGDRVSALERQLAELLARFTGPADVPPPPATDVYWALGGLRDRVSAETSGAVLYTGTVDLPTGEHYDWQYGVTVDDLLEADWGERAGKLGALGHPVRLQLLHNVLAGTRTAAELAADDDLGTTGQVYHHLRQLVSAGWLQSSARGQYSVPGDRVVPLLVILAGV